SPQRRAGFRTGFVGTDHPLTLVSGDRLDGLWEGTFTIPEAADPGDHSIGVWAEDTWVNDGFAPDATSFQAVSRRPPRAPRPVPCAPSCGWARPFSPTGRARCAPPARRPCA